MYLFHTTVILPCFISKRRDGRCLKRVPVDWQHDLLKSVKRGLNQWPSDVVLMIVPVIWS